MTNASDSFDAPLNSFNELLHTTIRMQQGVQQALILAIVVLRGPDKQMRNDALDALATIADAIGDSNARLEELL